MDVVVAFKGMEEGRLLRIWLTVMLYSPSGSSTITHTEIDRQISIQVGDEGDQLEREKP